MDITIRIKDVLKGKKVAYFSMEMGLFPEFSTYSGGLGILAGDTVKSSADLNIPLIAVTLIARKGYFRQELTAQGRQIEHSDEWKPEKFLTPLPQKINVEIEGRFVTIGAWVYIVESTAGGEVPVIFLDTDVEENSSSDKELTSYLYGGDENYRIKQEIILGIGGVRMLRELGVDVIKFHLNEGHASFLILELLKNFNFEIDKVRKLCVFTTHTPVEAGHDKFSYEHVSNILPSFVDLEKIKEFAGEDSLNMTLLALNSSGFVNGVAKKHRETTKKMFPGYEIRSITNGVHSYTWTHPALRCLYDKYIPGWAKEPELLARVEVIPNEEVWEAHYQAKKELIDYVNRKTNENFLYDVFTIGFARRVTTYKRHALLFSDIPRLKSINKKFPIQIIFAGKAHPHDEPGKRMIEELFAYSRYLKNDIKIAYLENYNMEIAKKFIPGVDVWLNTPQRPLEASGTSGMKAAHNGGINFSVPDGWWSEGYMEGITGWAIGPSGEESAEEIYIQEKHDLYGKLEYAILPLFYQQRDNWIRIMKNSIAKIACYFNSHRMMRHYITEAYFISNARDSFSNGISQDEILINETLLSDMTYE